VEERPGQELRANSSLAAPLPDQWLAMRFRTNWLWWVVGGYYVSSLVFSCADLVNQFVLPESAFEVAESVVSQMINPEGNDRWAMAVAALAPCVSAPWWEEVLYRGFLLPTLTLFMPITVSVPLSGILFGVHHQIPNSVIPLAALGAAWATIYVLSRNLWVTVLIHAMWNSRVFLGSLLGV
jgi:membrane protease YdiL (CAAX protease family)